MKLIIVRHGETEENVEAIVQGHEYGTLTDTGVEQAKKVAERLKDFDIDYIFSSDLERTRDTVKEIAKYHDVPLEFVEDLRERDGGVFNGRKVSELVNDREGKGLEPYEYKPQGGEHYGEVKERTSEFLEELIKNYKGDTVLLVSHGTAINIMVTYLLGMDISKTTELKQHNTAVNIFEFDGEKVENYVLDDLEHLK